MLLFTYTQYGYTATERNDDMEQYTVTGMSCAACQTRVEKAVSKVPGVTSCSVSLLTNSMGVEGTASSSEIIAAVQAAGYGASVKGAEKSDGDGDSALYDESALEDHETPVLKKVLSPPSVFSWSSCISPWGI